MSTRLSTSKKSHIKVGESDRKNWPVVYTIMRLMIIFVRYLMSLTGAIKQESCRHHCQQDSLSKTGPIVPTLLAFSL